MSYNGKECHRQLLQLGYDYNSILEDTFNVSLPDCVFVGIGSTSEPLHRFQFTISVSGQIISDPGHSLPAYSIKDSCSLGDQHHSCELILNQTQDSEAMCVIGSRPVDLVSTEAFGSLTAKWISTKSYKTSVTEITKWIMIVLLMSGSISSVVVLICCVVIKKPKRNNRFGQETAKDQRTVTDLNTPH